MTLLGLFSSLGDNPDENVETLRRMLDEDRLDANAHEPSSGKTLIHCAVACVAFNKEAGIERVRILLSRGALVNKRAVAPECRGIGDYTGSASVHYVAGHVGRRGRRRRMPHK